MAKKNNDNNSDWMAGKQDERLEQLEEKLTALYANAENEIRSEYTDFTKKFEKQDARLAAQVEAGEIPKDEYIAWRKTEILKSNQYSKAVESMSNMLVNTDVAAMATINGELPQVVAESYDFVQALGFEAADKANMSTGTFQIYNADTVEILIRDNPDLLPKASKNTIDSLGGTVDIPEDKKWAKDRINREITQGIVQGKSLTKIADSLSKVTTMDKNAAKRNARTAMTAAENMGRAASAKDLKENGIPVQEVWSASGDDHVRESHQELDGTTKNEAGYYGEGIIARPLRYPGDPDGDPEEVYNCRCRENVVLAGIDHSRDDELYEEFMKQFNEAEEYKGFYPEGEKTEEPIATSRSEDLPSIDELIPAEDLTSGSREVVQGEDLIGSWSRREDQFQFEIDDVLDAQGFNGLPKVVSEEEFNKAVEESGFIAQRTYAAPDQETLDAYRDQLYNGDWYVNCETGGAQYGQGMYCAADYNGQLTDGIKEEMEHYQKLGSERYDHPTPEEERPEATLNALPEDLANKESTQELVKAIAAGDDDKTFEIFKQIPEEERNEIYQAWHDSEYTRAVNYTETLTITPDANIVKYDDLFQDFSEYKTYGSREVIGAEIDKLEGASDDLKLVLKSEFRTEDVHGAIRAYNRLTDEELEEYDKLVPIYAEQMKAKDLEISQMDIGSYAALKGYDAINAEGHGQSGSYTVILNRTKVIFKGD